MDIEASVKLVLDEWCKEMGVYLSNKGLTLKHDITIDGVAYKFDFPSPGYRYGSGFKISYIENGIYKYIESGDLSADFLLKAKDFLTKADDYIKGLPDDADTMKAHKLLGSLIFQTSSYLEVPIKGDSNTFVGIIATDSKYMYYTRSKLNVTSEGSWPFEGTPNNTSIKKYVVDNFRAIQTKALSKENFTIVDRIKGEEVKEEISELLIKSGKDIVYTTIGSEEYKLGYAGNVLQLEGSGVVSKLAPRRYSYNRSGTTSTHKMDFLINNSKDILTWLKKQRERKATKVSTTTGNTVKGKRYPGGAAKAAKVLLEEATKELQVKKFGTKNNTVNRINFVFKGKGITINPCVCGYYYSKIYDHAKSYIQVTDKKDKVTLSLGWPHSPSGTIDTQGSSHDANDVIKENWDEFKTSLAQAIKDYAADVEEFNSTIGDTLTKNFRGDFLKLALDEKLEM